MPEIIKLDPFLDPGGADRMIEACRRYGTHHLYSAESHGGDRFQDKPQRFDTARGYLSGGPGFETIDPEEAFGRLNLFRETYAYGAKPLVSGIEEFLESPALKAAAQQVYGAKIVEPAIIFANIVLPGQRLFTHTDVPEFLGLDRKAAPQWLLVAMHHSGLFEAERIKIATCVSWYQHSDGGRFYYFDHQRQDIDILPNTAVVLDTDTVAHGVEEVEPGELGSIVGRLKAGAELTPVDEDDWVLSQDGEPLARLRTDAFRLSISWKGYCFASEAEHQSWAQGAGRLTLDTVLERMISDLTSRGLLPGAALEDDSLLAQTLVDAYIRYPDLPVAAA